MRKNFNHTSDDLERVRSYATLTELLEGMAGQLLADPLLSGCEISLLKESGDALVTACLHLPSEFSGIQDTYQGFQYRLEQPGAHAQVFKTARTVILTEADLGQFDETTRMRFERWKMRNLCVVPILVSQRDGEAKTIGTLAVFTQEHALDQALVSRLEELIDLYAPQMQMHWACQQAIERGKLVEVMYAEIQQFIHYITEMNSLTALEQVFVSIGREFIGRFGFDMVSLLLAEQGELNMVHTSFSAPFRHLAPRWESFRQQTKYSLSVRDGQSSMVFSTHQRFLVPDVLKILHLPMAEKDRRGLQLLETPRTFMIVPIRLNQEVIGVMWLVSLAKPVTPPEADLTLIELLASFISTAIRNAQAHMIVEEQNRQIALLNQDLKEKIVLLDQVARKDRLTGLYNFGCFEEELKRRASESMRIGKESALSIILLDIDHFKSFNDSWGHPAGNQVLQEVSARIARSVRDMDFVARYGGEEFVVLLPQCDLAGAEAIAQRIRRKVAEEVFWVDSAPHQLTISGGCAQFQTHESDKSFVGRADAALYMAKHRGRNRIEQAAEADQLIAPISNPAKRAKQCAGAK